MAGPFFAGRRAHLAQPEPHPELFLASGARPLEEFANFMTLAGGLATGAFLVLFAVGWGSLATRAAKSEWQLAPLLALSLVSFWFGATQLLNFFSNEYTPGKFLTNPVLPDAESIAIGESLYQEKGIENIAMPAFGDELTTEETWHLVNYVRRLSAQAVQVTQNQGPS